MEIDPVDVVAGITSGSSGSGPPGSTPVTAARGRTLGRWRRIPRAPPPSVRRIPRAPPSEEELWAREEERRATKAKLKDLRRSEEAKKLGGLIFRAEGYDPSSSTDPLSSSTDPLQQEKPAPTVRVVYRGSREYKELEEEANRELLEQAKRLEERDEDGCHTEEDKIAFRAFKVKFAAVYRSMATEKLVFRYDPPSDTLEENLTAEEVEMEAERSGWPVCPQAQHFATLALKHYNSTKKMERFEISKMLLSKCFYEVDGTMYAHVNFTATPSGARHTHLTCCSLPSLCSFLTSGHVRMLSRCVWSMYAPSTILASVGVIRW